MSRRKYLSAPVKPDESRIRLERHYPTFCFRHLQDVSIRECRDSGFFIKFMMRLKALSSIEWCEIDKAHRHGFGYEKIPVPSILVSLPDIITPDVKTLTVFRATGDNHSFIGFREGDIFRILFIEASFGDIYRH